MVRHPMLAKNICSIRHCLGSGHSLGRWSRPQRGWSSEFKSYMVKAAREAKRNTSWTDADPTYCNHLKQFVSEIVEGADAAPFLKDFLPFQRRIARVGVVHSLAQTLIKLTSPGVPDIYQGCELWDLSLVDPDNRRPVDYEHRRAMLRELRVHDARTLMAERLRESRGRSD